MVALTCIGVDQGKRDRCGAKKMLEALEIGLCWGTLQHANLIEMIEAAERHGFPTLSVRPDMVRSALDGGLSEQAIRRRLRDARVRVRVIDALTDGLPGQAAKPLEIGGAGSRRPDAETCFRAAEVVEAPLINISHYRGDPVPLQEMADAIGGISGEAGKRGLTMVIEFTPDGGIPNLGAALAIVQACGEPNCAILLDSWHHFRSGGTNEEVRALPPGAIGSIQLCDGTPVEPYVPMTGRELPGEGPMPLKGMVAAALEKNPGITAELEVFSEELRGLSTDQAAARAAAAVAAWRAG
jgi:sugar phosphate isomerase/epimerase